MKTPVIAHFNLARPILHETDASGYSIAGIISQQQDYACGSTDGPAQVLVPSGKGHWHLVACWSQSMFPAEWKYAVGYQVMLAIVMSCCLLRHYLKGFRNPVEVLTDPHNIYRFTTTKLLTGRKARPWGTLPGYNIDIVYRAGMKNPANAPNR